MANTLIWITTLIALLILFSLTILNVLKQNKNKMDAAWDELDKLWIRRRDIVPYLLETAKVDEGGRWNTLKNMRAELLSSNIPREKRKELEEQFENAIAAFISVAREHEEIKHNIGFLEAEKDLRKDIIVEIEMAEKTYEEAAKEYNDKTEKFPYSMASRFIS